MSDLDMLIAEWLQKAENDFNISVQQLKLGDKCPVDDVCFHAQQCVEKYMKAALVMLTIDFPKTHNISKLMELLPPDRRPSITHEQQVLLTNYATFMRYPGDYEPITLADARKAVAIARRVRKEIRKFLPPRALRTRRK